MNILVLNCGSSSIKYQLLNLEGDGSNLLAKGLVDRIGIDGSCLEHKAPNRETYLVEEPIENHVSGIEKVLDVLVNPEKGVIDNLNKIHAVGHRVAHGGETFKESVLITSMVKAGIQKCSALAPLHNPANLQGIEAMERLLPDVCQVAVFDTAYHQTIQPHRYLYALPYKFYSKYGIRKYGFHGTSHKFVGQRACKMLGVDFSKAKIITCHLGNGASIAAIKNGVSVDTSMGFTPNDGLMMGTRSGSVDPGALIYLANKEKWSLDYLNNMINRESGVLGVSEYSSDMRDLANAATNGHEGAMLAVHMYANRVKYYIGAYSAILNGVDIIVFTGGIGENNTFLRDLCLRDLDGLGIDFDPIHNGIRGKDCILTNHGSKVTAVAICTNEELVIAKETYKLSETTVRIM